MGMRMQASTTTFDDQCVQYRRGEVEIAITLTLGFPMMFAVRLQQRCCHSGWLQNTINEQLKMANRDPGLWRPRLAAPLFGKGDNLLHRTGSVFRPLYAIWRDFFSPQHA
ncbi:hypothetical protein D3C75_1122870 [compost metagenome]